MLALFGSAGTAAPGIWGNPLFTFLIILLGIYVFIKFCGWSKKFQLSGGFKKAVYIGTGLGLVVFNVMYSLGNKQLASSGDVNGALIAFIVSMAWVFLFAFALMAETKPE
ncbi:MAG TPA: hypothetical protein GXX58_01540 [Gelria sp.]|nr:hypothetical protein [Gelria sp.]